jgi:hypothetical protein
LTSGRKRGLQRAEVGPAILRDADLAVEETRISKFHP